MFGIVRIFLGVAIYLAIVLTINKLKLAKKPHRVLSVVLMIVIITVLPFIPFENLFVTFPSPEAAYKYCQYGKTNIALIVPGDECDLVINKKDDGGYELDYISKTNDGWKLSVGIDSKTIVRKHHDDVTIYIDRYKKSQDYFMKVFGWQSESLDLSDNLGTEFLCLQHGASDFTSCTYYAHISGFDENYKLFINGEIIEFN